LCSARQNLGFVRAKHKMNTAKIKYKTILVICTHNTVRSPFCEAIIRKHSKNGIYVTSAGVDADDIKNKHAIDVAKEYYDIDISVHTPQNLDQIEDENFDLVISLSQTATKNIDEMFKGYPLDILHWHVQKPPGMLSGLSQTQLKENYRQIFNEIEQLVLDIII